jgi:hypothetical protein
MSSYTLQKTASMVAVALLVAVHHLVGRVRREELFRGPLTISAATGVATAYVFVMLFPELAQYQQEYLREFKNRPFEWLKEQVFVLSLLGLLAITTLERWARRKEKQDPASNVPFALALSSSFLVNGAVGYTLAEAAHRNVLALGLVTIAYGAHLTVDDAELHSRWPERFKLHGRWLLTLSLFLGWMMRADSVTRGLGLAFGYCLLSGNIISDALTRRKLGEERENHRFFVGGALAFTLLVLLALKVQSAAAH